MNRGRWIVGVSVAVVVLFGFLATLILPPSPLRMPEQGFTLANVTLIEPGRGGFRREGVRLVGTGALIESIANASPGSVDPYVGAYVIPGLTDMHVHFPPDALPGQGELFAFLHLYHGVTTVRDAADIDGSSTPPVVTGIAAGSFPGPRIFSCGPLVDGPDSRWGNTIVVRNADEGRAAVQKLVQDGFQCVKVYDDLGAVSLLAIRKAARAAGLSVIGHAPRRVAIEDARLDDSQHLIGFPPPYGREGVPGPKFPLNLLAWRNLNDTRMERLIDASLARQMAHTPTLVTLDRLSHSRDFEAMRREPDAQLLPPFYREIVWSPDIGVSAAKGLAPEDFQMVEDALNASLRVVKRMHERGVRLHSGTDSLIAFVVPGASLHRELRLFVRAGLSPEEALAISTRASNDFLEVPGLGRLREGAPADLVVLSEDPTRSLDALDSIVAVIRDGRLYSREDLDAQLDRYKNQFDGAVYNAIIAPLIRRVLSATVKDPLETE